MMTWRLWRLFFRTLPLHPIFWRPFPPAPVIPSRQRRLHRIIRAALVLVIMPITMWVLFLPIFTLLPLWILFAPIYISCFIAISISRLTIREHEAGRYDQIAVTPGGEFGLSWALALRVLRRQPSVRQFLRVMRAVHIILLMTVLGISIVNLTILSPDYALLTEVILPGLLILILFIIFLRVDLMQAMLIGAMIGMLSPTWTRRTDAPLLAGALMLLLQSSLYVVVLLIVGGLTNAFNDADLLAHPEGILLIVLTGSGAVFVLHELMMAGMWRILSDRLNFNPRLLTTKEHDGT